MIYIVGVIDKVYYICYILHVIGKYKHNIRSIMQLSHDMKQ